MLFLLSLFFTLYFYVKIPPPIGEPGGRLLLFQSVELLERIVGF